MSIMECGVWAMFVLVVACIVVIIWDALRDHQKKAVRDAHVEQLLRRVSEDFDEIDESRKQ